jgi:hypothetical protein
VRPKYFRQNVHDNAYCLRAFADSPSDRLKLPDYYDVLHKDERIPSNDQKKERWAWLKPLMDRLLSTINPNEADAANRMSLALFMKWYEGMAPNSTPYETPPVSARKNFEPLTRQFPVSEAAMWARMAIAAEDASEGRHTQAAALLKEVCTTIDQTVESGEHS